MEQIIYVFLKTSHILFVISWMACVFVLPRAILYFKLAQDAGRETDVIETLCFKLFRFGMLMFVLTLIFGVWLWQGVGINGSWLHLKLLLVSLLLVYFLYSAWLLRLTIRKSNPFSNVTLRLFNEASLLLVIPIIYLAVAKTI